MIIQIYAGYLADADLFDQWCVERAETDPLFAKCFEDRSHFGELAIESYSRRKKAPWRKWLSVNYLPYQINEHGDIDESRKHTVFAFREHEYSGRLAKFSRWKLFQETDTDRKYKSQIEELGIALGPWTLVGIVGKQGLFYDFSPEVAAAILERMKTEYNQMEEAKARKAVQVARATNTGLTAKEDTVTTGPTGILPVDR